MSSARRPSPALHLAAPVAHQAEPLGLTLQGQLGLVGLVGVQAGVVGDVELGKQVLPGDLGVALGQAAQAQLPAVLAVVGVEAQHQLARGQPVVPVEQPQPGEVGLALERHERRQRRRQTFLRSLPLEEILMQPPGGAVAARVSGTPGGRCRA